MDSIDRALIYLDEHTAFSRDVKVIVSRSRSWPRRWLTAEEVEAHLRARDFWLRGRERVRPEARRELVRRYLERESAGNGPDTTQGWVGMAGQYRFRGGRESWPDPKEIAASVSDDRRRHGRVRAEMLHCQFGEVANISAAGLRITCRKRPDVRHGERVHLNLRFLDEEEIRVRARIVYVQATRGGYAIGCEFRSVRSETARRIRQLVQSATHLLSVADTTLGSPDYRRIA